MTNWDQISKNAIARYDARYRELGKNIRTLGWGSVGQQHLRFSQILQSGSLRGKTVLDIGCGFGDLLSFLQREETGISSYTGWDINENFIRENAAFVGEHVHFELRDLAAEITATARYDIAVMLGLLNFRLSSESENYAYTFHMIRKALELTRDVLVVDFLSSHLTPEYPQETTVFYHEPQRMMEFALSLTANVTLKHDYPPIPQKEFMLFFYP